MFYARNGRLDIAYDFRSLKGSNKVQKNILKATLRQLLGRIYKL